MTDYYLRKEITRVITSAYGYRCNRTLLALFHQLELVEDDMNAGMTCSYSKQPLARERRYVLKQIIDEQLRAFNND